jgi:GMP synthase-like glutamine amidotransferase
VRLLSIVHQRDAGPGVFAQVIAERGHELVEWMPPEQAAPELDGFGGAIVFGGAMHADQEAEHPWLAPEKRLLRELLERGTPVLGVCLGAQLLADAAGARPRRASEPEIGWHEVELTADAAGDPLAAALPERFHGFQWHSYEAPLPPGATPLARSAVCLQAFRVNGSAWGIQFHAEVSDESLNAWLDEYDSDPDAVRIGLDPEALRAESRPLLPSWHELGRDLCARFLDAATG